jgi:hypothetical protein
MEFAPVALVSLALLVGAGAVLLVSLAEEAAEGVADLLHHARHRQPSEDHHR